MKLVPRNGNFHIPQRLSYDPLHSRLDTNETVDTSTPDTRSVTAFSDHFRFFSFLSPGELGIVVELKHPRCVCNIKVQCKEGKNTTVYYL